MALAETVLYFTIALCVGFAAALLWMPAARSFGALSGLVGGMAAAALLSFVMARAQVDPSWHLVTVVLGIGGFAAGARHSWLGTRAGSHPQAVPRDEDAVVEKLLDTSVIIDGRVADLAETHFLEGPLVIPQFVLRELQSIADSPDALRRNRGRRGLDILQRLQKLPGLAVRIVDQDFPAVREVDMKLIELAKARQARIVTNDLNLNKVAQVRGIEVLNVNEVANAMRPVVLPGESMKVFILKEGKEANQGIAYMDDGTMVVVDNARRLISKTVDIVVTSVLQTTAGKMIFAKYDDRHDRAEPPRTERSAASAS